MFDARISLSILKTSKETACPMAIYAIGDIQGCCDSMEALVARLPLVPNQDQLWFVGDLVNRGPKSAKTLRRIMSAGRHAVSVLGNHDLHLLAVAAGVRKAQATDTVQGILRARDAADLIDWVRSRPLAHAQGNWLMVHAGVLPQWSLKKTLLLANEVSQRLRSAHWVDFLHEMYGNSPAHWKDSLKGHDRLRMIVNVLTRIRYLNADGSMDFKNKLGPKSAPKTLTPWFKVKNRKTAKNQLVFGHWSTLGMINTPNLLAIDTGCVWGRTLTAARLDDRKIFSQPCLEAATKSRLTD
jgi:bis(5'-nucleosyl)-tetraphosphatase (symmetrical)